MFKLAFILACLYTAHTQLAYCPISNLKICQNNGICLIVNGNEINCKCFNGFTGTSFYIFTSLQFHVINEVFLYLKEIFVNLRPQ